MNIYDKTAFDSSKITTKNYSTSFSAGVRMLRKDYRDAIYGIYGFVRIADEIVDTFHDYPQAEIFDRFKKETYLALDEKISTNPIIHSFQKVVNEYNIGRHLIDAFLFSMEMDLKKKEYSSYDFNRYVYGSAEVVGLMCLKVFYKDDDESYKRLIYPARKLGHAFQIVNFLRDLKSDYEERGRIYFPNVDFEKFTQEDKRKIEMEIEASFYEAWHGIMHLKKEIRTGVYLSYLYFVQLLRTIRKTSPDEVMQRRYSVPTWQKAYLAVKAVLDLRLGFAKKPERLNLIVNIDNKSGFCGGVVKAIEKAEELLDLHGELYCVGEIVHNEEEVRRLEEKGLVTIEEHEIEQLNNKHILFRAHGEPPKSYYSAKANNNVLTDATCPIVLRIQDRMKKAIENEETLFLFGKKTHPETIGLQGHVKGKATVVENLAEIKTIKLPQQLSLFTQTTKDPVEFGSIVEYIKQQGVDIKVYDTICRSVSGRKDGLLEFSKKHDKVLFVAGENSSNGKVLYAACKKANANTFFIHSPNNIVRSWFKKGETVGICGATSTPMWLMEEVQNIVTSY